MAVVIVPGDSGIINCVISEDKNFIDLTWALATDISDVPIPGLKYEVRKSRFDVINTLGNAIANGKIVKKFTTDLTSFTVKNDANYFAVIVRDDLGNKALYNSKAICASDEEIPLDEGSRRMQMWFLIGLIGVVYIISFIFSIKYVESTNKRTFIMVLGIVFALVLIGMVAVNFY